MKKLFTNKSITASLIILFSKILFAQGPFLEIKPFVVPSFEQYPVSQQIDHQYPTSNITDNFFLRFDGFQFEGDVIYPDCLPGSSCYDGHSGIDFHMPFDTPILAPASGYVLWASFTDPADPCPGGIEPNGDQGTIILAHGNNYFSVYLHMNPPLNVSVGDNVITGDTLGFNGNSGCAIDAHLHFEIRKGNWFFDTNDSWAVDPYGWWGDSIDPIENLRENISEWLWVSSLLVDDGDNGFQRYQGPEWSYLDFGYDDDSWSAPATTNSDESRHFSIWVPYLDNAGEYEIEAFIPDGFNATNGAIYEIIIKDSNNINTKLEFVVDQTLNPGMFNSIATLNLPSGSNCSIILRDIVSESSSGANIYFDAIRFSGTDMTRIIKDNVDNLIQNDLLVLPAYPNPFNPNTSIKYEIKTLSDVFIKIYDSRGIMVSSYIENNRQKGLHTFNWMAKSSEGNILPSGLYFVALSAGNEIHISKVVLIK
tara:strand:- start:81 stop:1520 length:1440 start_codon:yes stop_codon:yes gene_type:complete